MPSTSDAEDDDSHISSAEHDGDNDDDNEGNGEQVNEEKVLTRTSN